MKNNVKLAQEAVELVKPAIDKLFEIAKRKELHIVVMDPTIKPWECDFADAILYQETIGNPEQWPVKFDDLARNKAAQAWRNSSANINMHTAHPSSIRDDDCLFYGSFVYGDIVVGCSGIESHFDMLISAWIALAFEQLAIHSYEKDKADTPMKPLRVC
ncbi:hypothetical protein E2R68_08615 [Psychromonas sp. RZ22]|uniref:hypothetical protein n=1 Tax=Psychromonas algarum TaxID=2555643 RepID=UPI0010672DB3|nr:hypothetical protein [Psychromonas sp. RZ22]TEW54325.1 hypothetical protein E2R68_08615 [Psychromonas sp. RZ22]